MESPIRAKKMAIQADDMFDFTRGQGRVKTTQDLFTLAEYFAEECNILYKVIRLYSYDVPTGEDKRQSCQNVRKNRTKFRVI